MKGISIENTAHELIRVAQEQAWSIKSKRDGSTTADRTQGEDKDAPKTVQHIVANLDNMHWEA